MSALACVVWLYHKHACNLSACVYSMRHAYVLIACSVVSLREKDELLAEMKNKESPLHDVQEARLVGNPTFKLAGNGRCVVARGLCW